MQRPKIKNEHWPVRYGTNVVRIGGIVPKIAVDIRDPDGWVWALMGLLDGTRTVGQVVDDLAHRFPDLTFDEVRTEVNKDLGKLMDAGFVEDAAELPPHALTAAERERYSRSHPLLRMMDRGPRRSSWDIQMLLRQARVVVIGVGGVGGTAALSLTLSGVGEIHLVEPDVVELSNLNRQVLFTEQDVGRLKVEVAMEHLRSRNSDIKITGEASTITGPQALAALAARFDVVVLAADQPQEITSWTNQACVDTGTAWAHGDYHGPRVNVAMYRPRAGACYDCARIDDQERRAALPVQTPLPGRPMLGPHPTNAITAGVTGQHLAHFVISLITDVPCSLQANKEYRINLAAPEHSVVLGPSAARADCPTCGIRYRPAS
jgi:molybdopterin/thiamine biosynthesis adenylyltransferase